MQTVLKILCPVDFSEPSLAAARRAASLARDMGAKLVLVTALDQGGYMLEASAHMQLQWEEYERETLRCLSALAGELDAGQPVAAHVRVGRPHEVIEQQIQDESADLVVMGTHGRTGLGKWLLGSVAERVLRTTHVPVLTLRAG